MRKRKNLTSLQMTNRSAASNMNQDEEFVELITNCQGRLFAYINAALGNADSAVDVLQETNLVIWRKSSEFEPGTNFEAWAFQIASFQVMAFRQRRMRDRLKFDRDIIEQITRRAAKRGEVYEARLTRLSKCINKLPERSRAVVRLRYSQGESLRTIAKELHRTENAISQLVFRIRRQLLDCISSSEPKVKPRVSR